jgi:hypothetical protein
MFNGEVTQRTLELLKGIDLAKATFQTSTGLVNYDLTGPAKKLYPVLSPLRNALPRVMGNGDTATRWKAITGINTANLAPGVAEGHRGGRIQVNEQDFTAAYAGLGLEGDVTFEALFAAEGFDDARARTVESVLRSLMIAEEKVILSGNNSLALGTPVAPVATGPTSGGSITAQSGNLVFVVALTAEGYASASVAGGVPGSVNRTNIDGTSDTYGGGSSNASAASNAITTTSGNQTISATVTAIPGAVAYAWYLGTSAANAGLAAITTTNSVTLNANAAGSQKANAITADNSQNNLEFDGFITQLVKNVNGGGNGYYKSLNGAFLTSDGASGIVEIDAALKSHWDANRLTPTKIWVSSQEAANINKKVLTATGVPLFRINLDSSGKPVVIGGSMVAGYFNKFASGGGQLIPMEIHPYLTAGTLLMQTEWLPYPLSNVDNVAQIKCRRDYHQIDWPITSRTYQFGVYVDEVLQVFAPFAFAVLQNIGNG